MSGDRGSAAPPLAINYLVEDTALFGGVKVVLQQANLLGDRGHRVTIVSRAERPDWFDVRCGFERVRTFAPSNVPEADITVATYWTTIEPAIAAERGQAVHYCQGFEWIHNHNRADHERIRQVYEHPVPAMAVSPHLIEELRHHFGRPARWVPQPLEPFWRPRRLRRSPARPPRVLICGPFEIDWKGVATALEAVREMRRRGVDCRIVRLSQWPLSDPERSLLAPDEFHHHLPPRAAAELVRGCDLLLAPSWRQEGFGLPVLEAMASGVPVVASDIDCFRGFASEAARLVPFDQPERFAEAALELLSASRIWRRHRRAGVLGARPFSESSSAASAEDALRWAQSGDWR